MALLYLFVLAVVQGVTEFLPISSSAHLILVPRLMGTPDQGLVIDVAVHVGTLVAVLLYFRQEVKGMLRGALSFVVPAATTEDDAPWRQLAGAVIIAAKHIFNHDAQAPGPEDLCIHGPGPWSEQQRYADDTDQCRPDDQQYIEQN